MGFSGQSASSCCSRACIACRGASSRPTSGMQGFSMSMRSGEPAKILTCQPLEQPLQGKDVLLAKVDK